eukprot:GHVN01015288.1.p1 GENE.GHVN01015288.1~~GHVN01015288.1.p1  ORF type:complete len:411 (-),score=148.54 GHVN01015288.1:184-1236(-)
MARAGMHKQAIGELTRFPWPFGDWLEQATTYCLYFNHLSKASEAHQWGGAIGMSEGGEVRPSEVRPGELWASEVWPGELWASEACRDDLSPFDASSEWRLFEAEWPTLPHPCSRCNKLTQQQGLSASIESDGAMSYSPHSPHSPYAPHSPHSPHSHAIHARGGFTQLPEVLMFELVKELIEQSKMTEGKEQLMCRQAVVSVLEKFSIHEDLSPLSVLQIIPDNWSLTCLYTYLTSWLQHSTHSAMRTQVQEQLTGASFLDTFCKWGTLRKQRVSMTHERCCAVCNCRIGSSSFASLPKRPKAHNADKRQSLPSQLVSAMREVVSEVSDVGSARVEEDGEPQIAHLQCIGL